MPSEISKWNKIVRLPHGNFTARIVDDCAEGKMLKIEYTSGSNEFPSGTCWIEPKDIIGTITSK